jgi:hypothetical protein
LLLTNRRHRLGFDWGRSKIAVTWPTAVGSIHRVLFISPRTVWRWCKPWVVSRTRVALVARYLSSSRLPIGNLNWLAFISVLLYVTQLKLITWFMCRKYLIVSEYKWQHKINQHLPAISFFAYDSVHEQIFICR